MPSNSTNNRKNHKIHIKIDTTCKRFYPHLKDFLNHVVKISLDYIQKKEIQEIFEISIHVINDKKIRKINKKYRNKDKPTDVLSFSQLEGLEFPRIPEEPLILGDILISYETALRQSQEYGHSLEYEMIRLVVHGIYHLLGYDHERSKEENCIMSRKEKQLIKHILKHNKIIIAQ